METQKPSVHMGEILKAAVKLVDPKRHQLAKAMGISKDNLYKLFGKERIKLQYFVRAGKYLNYDFSTQVPELPEYLEHTPETVSNRDVQFYKDKLIKLQEEHIELMKKYAGLLEKASQ